MATKIPKQKCAVCGEEGFGIGEVCRSCEFKEQERIKLRDQLAMAALTVQTALLRNLPTPELVKMVKLAAVELGKREAKR